MSAGPSPTWEKSEEGGQSEEEESMVSGGSCDSGLTSTSISSFTTPCKQGKVHKSNLISKPPVYGSNS